MMNFDPEIEQFLSGSKFSNALVAKLFATNPEPMASRVELLKDICRGKRVVHIGFADHLPLIDQKRQNQTWLHDILCSVASSCVGVDVNAEAVNYCKNKLKIPSVYHSDLMTDAPIQEITSCAWDVAILGEIVEHLTEPVALLRQLKTKYGACIKQLVITVPNAWDIANFGFALKSQEFINSDHRFWFTPYTLAKICRDAGYATAGLQFANQSGGENYLWRWLRQRYPMLRQSLIGTFNFA